MSESAEMIPFEVVDKIVNDFIQVDNVLLVMVEFCL